MELQYLRQDALDYLVKNIGNNINHYSNKDESNWVDLFFRENNIKRPIFSTGLVIDDICLQNGDSASLDADNAIMVHKALKGKINAVQATDRRLWIALTHTVFSSYMYSRWPVKNELNEKNLNGTVTDRYFMARGLFRNGISRLYWIPELTICEELEDPYEYTKYLISKQDLINQIDGQSFCRNREILISCLKALKQAEPLTEIQRRNFFQNLCKRGGVTVLDALGNEDMSVLCFKTMESVTQMKAIKNGSKIVVQSLNSDRTLTFEVKAGQPFIGKTVFRSIPNNLYRLTIGKEVTIGNNKYRIIDIS